MPIYEYQCNQCDEVFTKRQSMDEDGSKVTCPKCHAGNPKKLISSFFGQGTGGCDTSSPVSSGSG
jgi:putative FmdB family regulatory protein